MPFWYFFSVPKLPAEIAHQSNHVDLVKYLAKEGSNVDVGSPVALLENWWAMFELKANGRGILKKTFFDPGTSIGVGDPIAIIACDGEDCPHGRDDVVLKVVQVKREKSKQSSLD